MLKTIFLNVRYLGKIEIVVDSRDLTSGWLYCQALRQLVDLKSSKSPKALEDFDFDNFVGLKSKFDQFNIDYILSEPSMSLEHIPDGTEVEPYFATWPQDL